MKNSKGNRKAQIERRKKALRAIYEQYKASNPNVKAVKFQLIDGNMSYYPVAFCKYYEGYMTQGMVNCHRCHKRHCGNFVVVERDAKGRIKENLFLKRKILNDE